MRKIEEIVKRHSIGTIEEIKEQVKLAGGKIYNEIAQANLEDITEGEIVLDKSTNIKYVKVDGLLVPENTSVITQVPQTFSFPASTLVAEVDPIYVASSWYTTTNNSANWDTAYGWGNHASAGYQTNSNLRTSWQVTPDDTHYPSEKLVKDNLDLKANLSGADFTGDINFYKYSNSAGVTSRVTFYKARGTQALPTAITIGTFIGRLGFSGYDGSGFVVAANFISKATESWDISHRGNKLELVIIPTGGTTLAYYTFVDGKFVLDTGYIDSKIGYYVDGVQKDINWDTAYSWGNHAGLYTPIAHKTTEDALNGLVKVDGAGNYSAVTDNSSAWNTAVTNLNYANLTAGYVPYKGTNLVNSPIYTDGTNIAIGGTDLTYKFNLVGTSNFDGVSRFHNDMIFDADRAIALNGLPSAADQPNFYYNSTDKAMYFTSGVENSFIEFNGYQSKFKIGNFSIDFYIPWLTPQSRFKVDYDGNGTFQGYVNAVSGFKANGTAPVADGTYTPVVSITTKGGLITAIS